MAGEKHVWLNLAALDVTMTLRCLLFAQTSNIDKVKGKCVESNRISI